MSTVKLVALKPISEAKSEITVSVQNPAAMPVEDMLPDAMLEKLALVAKKKF